MEEQAKRSACARKKIKQSSGIKDDRSISAQVVREGLSNETLLCTMQTGNDSKVVEKVPGTENKNTLR